MIKINQWLEYVSRNDDFLVAPLKLSLVGNSLFEYLWILFVCYDNKPRRHFARNSREFGVARSEELEV